MEGKRTVMFFNCKVLAVLIYFYNRASLTHFTLAGCSRMFSFSHQSLRETPVVIAANQLSLLLSILWVCATGLAGHAAFQVSLS